MNPKTVLQTQQLTIGYPKHTVSQNIDVQLFAGELVCLIGPNGAGKTTLMRTLAGMLSPLAGRVQLLGDDVRKLDSRVLAQRLSVVLTDRIDVGLLSGYGLVALGRHPYTDWTGQLSPQDESVVRWAVDAVGASEIAARPVNELSDGERQKLMIARALAQATGVVHDRSDKIINSLESVTERDSHLIKNELAVMLLDEPTAFLDLPRRVEILQLLRKIARETERAILLSTHDLDLALRNADSIWLMPKNDSLTVGAPEDLVLNGAFEGAFQSEGVQFDKRTGSFTATIDTQKTIALQGEGIRYIWTQRALERIGYKIAETSDLRVIVNQDSWILKDSDMQTSYDDLYRLVAALSSR